ncbi:hypothetical protein QH494_06070 [Sphingomonas sp. AR_OL41]|uniref:ParB/RepB/Spo0J family partition protein n=1 Tax=Sphingomonas sp. AR_OL41 TaxID=3042729 RepID=UPI00248010C3|nr:hypothetical protein [Sphingomonas sp. AR_OL41]MDH7971744.1 hypothetical protein [Sphingomonas sp. AR_OL41]
MASAPANPHAVEIAGEIVILPVDQITIGERLRAIDDVWAMALGQVMAREGQQTAIEVCRLHGKPGWQLVAGAHRLTGARLVGMEFIEAREVSPSDAHRRMREVSENLWHRGLEPIDRAAFIAELVTIHKLRIGIDPTKDGRAASAAVRWSKAIKAEADDATATLATAYGWTAEIGEQLGLSARTVRDDLFLFRRLLPSSLARLREHRHPVATNASQLRALAKLEGREQEAVVDFLVWPGMSFGHPVPKTVAEALAYQRKSPAGAKSAADPEAKRLGTFLATFGRMSLAEKKGALAHLAEQLPAGFKIINEEDA